mgnify:CR=1 FL=1
MKKLICFLLLSASMSVIAQKETTRLKHLKDVLIELNDLYNVKFSFSDEVINNKKIVFKNNKNKTLAYYKRARKTL